ncbi:hypothetical protein K6119_13050 [Paracrocinitomix mangrovi]|uniref:hypothetical protein n=1 Tax=Paracrocinitomix mangrovi TaxID=2862509 RepID=UPI001C8F0FF2|nr:hypothetical protein [Paracrocinitomix mangrovi]UKN00657.1 hypothetical protein K6119_13050 [Paracrocinitomix mangrovi]
MRFLVAILFLTAGALSWSQRPDLSIGLNGSNRFLSNKQLNSTFLSPGVNMQMEVSKRSLLIGLQNGYWITFDQADLNNYKNQHHVNVDVVTGVIFIRKPKFKLGLKPIVSNVFSLTNQSSLNQQNLFTRYALQFVPELNLKYKLVEAGLTYSLPLVGTSLSGPGIKLGIMI